MGSSWRGKSILFLLDSWDVCGRRGGGAEIVFHTVLWMPIFHSEAGALHCGRCEGKQLDDGLGFFFLSVLS